MKHHSRKLWPPGRRALILAAALCLIAESPQAQDETPQARLAGFVTVARGLYQRAGKIIAEAPKTDADILRIAMIEGTEWQKDERDFQISFWPMAHDESSDLPDDVREGVLRIWQFDNFVFDAVGAAYHCRDAEARWRLGIAREILKHAQMAAAGDPQPDWVPDLADAPVDRSYCTRLE